MVKFCIIACLVLWGSFCFLFGWVARGDHIFSEMFTQQAAIMEVRK